MRLFLHVSTETPIKNSMCQPKRHFSLEAERNSCQANTQPFHNRMGWFASVEAYILALIYDVASIIA